MLSTGFEYSRQATCSRRLARRAQCDPAGERLFFSLASLRLVCSEYSIALVRSRRLRERVENKGKISPRAKPSHVLAEQAEFRNSLAHSSDSSFLSSLPFSRLAQAQESRAYSYQPDQPTTSSCLSDFPFLEPRGEHRSNLFAPSASTNLSLNSSSLLRTKDDHNGDTRTTTSTSFHPPLRYSDSLDSPSSRSVLLSASSSSNDSHSTSHEVFFPRSNLETTRHSSHVNERSSSCFTSTTSSSTSRCCFDCDDEGNPRRSKREC